MDAPTPEIIDKIAREFCWQLVSMLAVEDFERLKDMTRTMPAAGTCYSHNFIDSNELMEEAMKEATDAEFDIKDPNYLEAWLKGWNLAIAWVFEPPPESFPVAPVELNEPMPDRGFTRHAKFYN